MSKELFETGNCTTCGHHTGRYCDECSLWCCDEHSRTIEVAEEDFVDFCIACGKRVSIGVRLGGVIIKEEMLSE